METTMNRQMIPVLGFVACLATVVPTTARGAAGGCGTGTPILTPGFGVPQCSFLLDCRTNDPQYGVFSACTVSARMHVDGVGHAGGTVQLEKKVCNDSGACQLFPVDTASGVYGWNDQASDYCWAPTGCEGTAGGQLYLTDASEVFVV